MAGVPLSKETKHRLAILFDGEDAALATKLLVNDCGSNLPLLDKLSPSELDRFRFAAVKLSQGKLQGLEDAIRLAQEDWRDLLVAAGFANAEAHRLWNPETTMH
jgi:hypothetical protein